MTAIPGLRSLRVAGALAGATLALAASAVSRPTEGGFAAGADVALKAPLSGELAVAPAAPEPFLRTRSLQPSQGWVTGTFTVRNQTAEPQSPAIRLVPSSPELNRALRVRVRDRRGVAASGLLGRLGHPQRDRGVRIASGETRRIEVGVRLAGADPAAWRGARVEVSVELMLTDPGGRR